MSIKHDLYGIRTGVPSHNNIDAAIGKLALDAMSLQHWERLLNDITAKSLAKKNKMDAIPHWNARQYRIELDLWGNQINEKPENPIWQNNEVIGVSPFPVDHTNQTQLVQLTTKIWIRTLYLGAKFHLVAAVRMKENNLPDVSHSFWGDFPDLILATRYLNRYRVLLGEIQIKTGDESCFEEY